MMKAQVIPLFEKLHQSLEEMTKLYRQLLDVVRKEKEHLISVSQVEIEKCFLQKEELIGKVRLCDMLREKYAQNLAVELGLETTSPRLLELAQNLPLREGDLLRQHHASLEMVIKRVQELNRENEAAAQQALRILGGALGDIKETLAGKNTYERKGKYKTGPEQSGHFVSKEA
ncbi:MAG: flagellar protein FlgN [Bdellovibrionales bacterium]